MGRHLQEMPQRLGLAVGIKDRVEAVVYWSL